MQWNILKASDGSSPYYDPTNPATYSQTQTGATVPLKLFFSKTHYFKKW
jgi:hypothetical protein